MLEDHAGLMGMGIDKRPRLAAEDGRQEVKRPTAARLGYQSSRLAEDAAGDIW